MLETQFPGLFAAPSAKSANFPETRPDPDSMSCHSSNSPDHTMSDNRSSPSPPRACTPTRGHSTIRASKSSAFSVESLLLKEEKQQLPPPPVLRSPPGTQSSEKSSQPADHRQHQYSSAQVGSGSAFAALHRHPHSFYNYMSLMEGSASLKSELEAAAVAAASYPDLSYNYAKYAHLHHHHSLHHQQQQQSHQSATNPLCSLREWSESQARFNRTFGSLGSAAAAAAAAAAHLTHMPSAAVRSPGTDSALKFSVQSILNQSQQLKNSSTSISSSSSSSSSSPSIAKCSGQLKLRGEAIR